VLHACGFLEVSMPSAHPRDLAAITHPPLKPRMESCQKQEDQQAAKRVLHFTRQPASHNERLQRASSSAVRMHCCNQCW
jgi:hypothetical protein